MNNPNNLRINREERRFLGVCAGLADYLDVPVVLVRIIFIVSVLTWPTMIVGYFLLYFCMDNQITQEKIQEFFNGGATRHFSTLDYRRPIYRNMHNKRIAGVCSGIAEYLEVSPFWVRAGAVGLLFIFGPYAVLAYVIGWFAMEPNVVVPAAEWKARRQARKAERQARRAERYRRRAERHLRRARKHIHSGRLSDAYETVASMDGVETSTVTPDGTASDGATGPDTASASTVSADECGRLYYEMETRLRQIEAFITSRRFRLHCEINRA